MNYFDLHCDSILEMYHNKLDLYSNKLGVSIDKYANYNKKAQFFAVWCDEALTNDECYLNFQRVTTDFNAQLEKYADSVMLCTNKETLCEDTSKLKAVLSVEDARLLGNDISRLEKLYGFGVRFLTLGWKGSTNVCGAYDTEDGLTPFGFEVLRECENLGITVDVSHLSEKSFWDVAGKATKPFCATHSNSLMLCQHRRNLTDTQFRTIAACGGVVGVNFVGEHLSPKLLEPGTDENTVYETVVSHIEHFLKIAPSAVCIGSDFDGTAPIPGLENLSDVQSIAKALSSRGYDDSVINDIMYNNAFSFVKKSFEN